MLKFFIYNGVIYFHGFGVLLFYPLSYISNPYESLDGWYQIGIDNTHPYFYSIVNVLLYRGYDVYPTTDVLTFNPPREIVKFHNFTEAYS